MDWVADWLAWKLIQRLPPGTWQSRLVTTLYRWFKWIVHQFRGISHIERLSLFAIQPCTSKEEYHQSIVNIIAQITVSQQLSAPVEHEKPSTLARTIASIKKIDPDSVQFTVLQEAVEDRHKISEAFEECLDLSRVKPTWDEYYSTKLLGLYQDMFDVECDDKQKPDWVRLGFQGTNPTTDFRSTGKFGFECFYHYCSQDKLKALNLLKESGSIRDKGEIDVTKPWYSAALVSIHISQFILSLEPMQLVVCLLNEGYTPHQDANLEILRLHSRLLDYFHTYWRSAVDSGTVKSVLDTEQCLESFRHEYIDALVAA